MQNALVYHFVAGHAWFTSTLVFLFVLSLDLFHIFDARKRLQRIARVTLFFLIAFALLSGTSVSLLFAIPLLGFASFYAAVGFSAAIKRRRILGIVSALLTVVSIVIEAPYHLAAPLSAPKRMYVLADSIAAGGFGEKRRYPELLGDFSGIEVKNLALAGATFGSAFDLQVQHIPAADRDAWIFIELGGNDMFHGTSSADFGINMEKVLQRVAAEPGTSRRLVMQELPLVPGFWSFGRIQRELAAKYQVSLIPKRVLAGVLLKDGNTVDGIHLTQTGHEYMARELARWFAAPKTEP